MKKINLTEYIQKTALDVRLTDEERARMKRMLSEYVAMKPLRAAPLDRRAPLLHALISVYAFSRKSIAGVMVFTLLFSGAGVSFAAENAVPGDVLYPIKVEVNEPVVAALSVSQESKVLWNAERAERRLEEAALLASNGTLTDERKKELEERFDQHAERVIAEVERIEADDSSTAVDIASRFENRLLAHETVLEDVEEGGDVKRLKDKIRTRAERLAFVRERAGFIPPTPVPVSAAVAIADVSPVSAFSSSESVSVMAVEAPQPAMFMKREANEDDAVLTTATMSAPEVSTLNPETVKRIARRAAEELKDVQKLFERYKGKLEESTASSISEQIRVASLHMLEADTQLATGEIQTAFETYRNVSISVTKLTVAMKAFGKSKIQMLKPQSDEERGDDFKSGMRVQEEIEGVRSDDERKERSSFDSERPSDD